MSMTAVCETLSSAKSKTADPIRPQATGLDRVADALAKRQDASPATGLDRVADALAKRQDASPATLAEELADLQRRADAMIWRACRPSESLQRRALHRHVQRLFADMERRRPASRVRRVESSRLTESQSVNDRCTFTRQGCCSCRRCIAC